MKNKVCIISGSRAEFGLLKNVITRMTMSDLLMLQLIVTVIVGVGPRIAYDDMARYAHRKAMALQYDRYLSLNQRHFLYLPLQHSEAKEDQARSISLYRMLGDAEIYKFAIRHKEIIDRFGRFPHRNKILGRKSTQAEKSFLTEPLSAF